MIVFNNVSKIYTGGINALNDISLEITQGEFVFLIGPSGAGKSTILNLITRAVHPTSGQIFVEDFDISTLQKTQIYQLRRMIGVVFQDFKILPARTVYENIGIALEILGKKELEMKQEIYDILELVGLEHKANYFPLQLSAGERQRVSMARALVGGPSILLADEPTGNLDPNTAQGIFDILNEVNKIGTTVIVATHNDSFVNAMKKRTITVIDGEIASDDPKGKYTSFESSHKSRKKLSKRK